MGRSTRNDGGKRSQRLAEKEARRKEREAQLTGGTTPAPTSGVPAVPDAAAAEGASFATQPARARDEDFERKGAFTIYKAGQGYYVRLVTGIAVGVLTLLGAWWMFNDLLRPSVSNFFATLLQYLVPLAVIALGGWLVYYVTGKSPKTNEFFISTEIEMRKVNWASRREVVTSTQVVIFAVVFFAVFFAFVDVVFRWFFKLIGVLHIGS